MNSTTLFFCLIRLTRSEKYVHIKLHTPYIHLRSLKCNGQIVYTPVSPLGLCWICGSGLSLRTNAMKCQLCWHFSYNLPSLIGWSEAPIDAWDSTQCVQLGAGTTPRESPLLLRHGHWKCGLLNSLVNPVRVHSATSTPTAIKTPPTRMRVARLDEKKHVYINATRKESALWQVKVNDYMNTFHKHLRPHQ